MNKQRSVPELNITLLRYFRYLLVESRHDGKIGVALGDFSAFRKISRNPKIFIPQIVFCENDIVLKNFY